MVRELTADDVTFSLECEPEDMSIEGNCMASGDDDVDAEQEQWIRDQLDDGNEWAWCQVTVVATWREWEGKAHLGGCSYLSKEDFMQPGGYYDDLKSEALDDLNTTLTQAAEALDSIRE